MAIEFLKCPECRRDYVLASISNIRNGKWQVIPLEVAPKGVRGNFDIRENELVMAKDLALRDVGPYPVALYGRGNYVPHNPSHFTGAPHMDEVLHRRHVAEEPRYGS